MSCWLEKALYTQLNVDTGEVFCLVLRQLGTYGYATSFLWAAVCLSAVGF